MDLRSFAGPGAPSENDWLAYGEQSSSLIAAYPEFHSFRLKDEVTGRIRYVDTKGARIAATEPFASRERRVEWFEAFARQARQDGLRAYMVPVGRALASQLKERGYSAISIGQEPVFELAKYFSGADPLLFLPSAKRLRARGLVVEEITTLTRALRERVRSMLGEWTSVKGSLSASFLSQVAPLKGEPFKRYFIARDGDSVVAILTALPIPARSACYLTDLLRAPEARHGTTELLLVETMRRLHAKGIAEARLGNCLFHETAPLASRSLRERVAEGLGRFFYRFGAAVYPARSIAQYKRKLRPTRWEASYLVSARPIGWAMLQDLADAHFPGRHGHVRAAIGGVLGGALANGVKLAERGGGTLTFALASAFLLLHGWRELSQAAVPWFKSAGYSPAAPSLYGWLAGPFFHDHFAHLAGDVLAFVTLGWVIESLFSRRLFLALLGTGFWLSNPLTVLLLSPLLRAFAPDQLPALMAELDYGSSNAVYAFAGAIAAAVKAPLWILLPFLLNGVAVCLGKGSWLALHHWVALGVGFSLGLVFLRNRS